LVKNSPNRLHRLEQNVFNFTCF